MPAGALAASEALAERRRQVDAALARVATFGAADPVSAAAAYAVAAGGKRLRPVLALAALEAVGGSVTDPLADAVASLELVHTYSLVHDDLPCMDDDDLRRGRPTTHRAFGTPAAMLAGFALIPAAARLLMERAADGGIPEAAAMTAVRELCDAAGARGMVGGQVLDLAAEGAATDAEGLRRIHRMKTAALFRAALRVGALLGGGTAAQVEALGEFGDHLGLAFQVTDDVLDVTRDAAALGKTPGKDQAAAKSTFVSLLGVPAARQAAQEEADCAVVALRRAGISAPLLEYLATFAVQRDR